MIRLYHELTGELELFVKDPTTRKQPHNLPKVWSLFALCSAGLAHEPSLIMYYCIM